MAYRRIVKLTFRYRVKDASSRKHLWRYAGAVNFVWNYLCETQRETERRRGGDRRVRWPTAFDLSRLTQGSGVASELGLHSDTVNGICRQFVASRNLHRKCPRFRSRRKGSLGWIPFNTPRAIRVEDSTVVYRKRHFHFWKSREISGEICDGSFACDARGRWYLNLVVDTPEETSCGAGHIGIDLGLKDFATLSDGSKIANPRSLRQWEQRLATAQRARRFERARAINAKIANTRKKFLHEKSTIIVRENCHIVVGDVNAKALMQTRMAKSIADASWSTFRNMLRYKALKHGAYFEEADERYTSQTCSACASRSGPKGIAGLRIREWICSDCGVVHDRDTNAAINLLAGAKRRPPAVEIPAFHGVGRR